MLLIGVCQYEVVLHGCIHTGITSRQTHGQVFPGYAAARLYSDFNDSMSSFTEMIFLIR